MTPDEKKRAVARAALEQIEAGVVLGVGTGSTADYFIEALTEIKSRIEVTVASSQASAARLTENGIPVKDLNDVGPVDLYVDGADEATRHRHLIKGGGGALTGEKILASASRRFVCIADDSKLVDVLGDVALPVEVIPMARSFVARKLTGLGGKPVWREGFETDNGNVILDVHNLDIVDPISLESALNQISGVVTNGLFALRPADLLLLGADDGIRHLE